MTKRWPLRTSGAAAVVCTLLALCGQGMAVAAPDAAGAPALEDKADPRERLEILQRQLDADRELQRRLDGERAKLTAEQEKLQHDLIEAAALVRAREDEQAKAAAEHDALSAKERVADATFRARQDQLAGLLAVLQRMGREPPPALLVKSGDAAVAARSAMVLTAVLPGVRDEARRLSADLTELKALRIASGNKKVELNRASHALNQQQKRIAALLLEKQRLATTNSAQLRDTSARVVDLSRETQSVEQLILRLNGEVKELSEAGFSTARLFAQRGRLPWPVTGEIVATFGEDNETGVKNPGITLKTRANAQVVSPVDGKIAFAGPFHGYGRLLIIVAGDGYHVVMTGMTDVYGEAGQVLLTGEPVGRMGGGGDSAEGGRRLNIEFHHSGNQVDPGPWFDGYDGKTRDKGHG